jgi:hypothetical protein
MLHASNGILPCVGCVFVSFETRKMEQGPNFTIESTPCWANGRPSSLSTHKIEKRIPKKIYLWHGRIRIEP